MVVCIKQDLSNILSSAKVHVKVKQHRSLVEKIVTCKKNV